jgi:hypothetical protein
LSTTVHAYPRKQFFIEMFTRDIALEDCILDLIDNSMDALLSTRKIDIESEFLAQSKGQTKTKSGKAQIRLDYSEKRLSIVDDCGGIPYAEARNEVFCFGHKPDAPKRRLGVYGIGMKRAIFKIGNHIQVVSNTGNDAFQVDIDVKEWAEKDGSLDDWTFPIVKLDGAALKMPAGTRITISGLHDEVKSRLDEGTIAKALSRSVAQSYPFFLGKLVDVVINGDLVEPIPLPWGGSEDVNPGVARFEQDGVKVTILATVAPKERRSQEFAGWYVMCNGRVVVNADKTALTGWGSVLPAFHSKYVGFVGLALLTSSDPSSLPWTTSKRGLNREALVFQRARNVMAGVAKPVITFLNDLYPSDPSEDPGERLVAEGVKQRDFRPLLAEPTGPFTRKVLPAQKKTVRVQFDAYIADIEKIKKKLRRQGLTASDVGRLTFNHYLDTECAE